MSPYVPTEFDDSVNVTKIHPLKEVARLVGGCIALIVALYVSIGFVFELALPHISISNEKWLWDHLPISEVAEQPLSDKLKARQAYLQTLMDKIPASAKPEGYEFKVHIKDSEDINAYALPGGNIVMTTALMDALKDENSLMFVLGHEIGHFANRDHLRSMGTGIAGILIAVAIIGQSDIAGRMVSNISHLTSLVYSRKAEQSADLWGLKALQAVYGHSGGATSFFKIMKDRETKVEKLVPGIFRTHPLDEDRIEALEAEIKAQHYLVLDTVPASVFARDPDPASVSPEASD